MADDSAFMVLFPSKFKARDVKRAILDLIIVVMIFHFCHKVSAASFARADIFNVLNGETAHAVTLDGGIAFVEINNMFVVESFNDRFFLGAEKGDEVVFGDEVFHGVGLCHG